jgi:hypothetical protein
MKATYSSGKPMPYFPFCLATYLDTKVLTLNERNPESNKRVRTISKALRIKQQETRFRNTVQKYIDTLISLGGEATSLQIARHLGYNTTSMANTLHCIAKQTSLIFGIKLKKSEYQAMGIRTGSGPLPYIWRHNPNGIIFPRDSDIQ